MKKDDRSELDDHLERLAKRLNRYVGSVTLHCGKGSEFLLVSHADYLILRQAYFHPMNRSSRRKIRERIFETFDRAKVSELTMQALYSAGAPDVDRPFLHMLYQRRCGSTYAVLKVPNVRFMEYLLYVRQSAFREALYRIQ